MKRLIVLASASPRRRSLLKTLNVSFDVENSGVTEQTGEHHQPSDYAVEMARQKAVAVAARWPDAVILGADTVVVADSEILGKPANEKDASRMLKLLRNRRHLVITGLALVDSRNGVTLLRNVQTGVQMADYSDQAILDYISGGEPLDKAGAYAIQGQGGSLVTGIDGCYTNVVGLPLCEVAEMLREVGIEIPAVPPPCTDQAGRPCPRSTEEG